MDILIVDDNEQIVSLLTELTRKWGHRPQAAENGRQALAILETRQFDLILLDIYLPDAVAQDLIPQFKMLWSGMEIITMTGCSTKELEQKIRSQGILYYMVKPVDTAELKSILDHISHRLNTRKK